MLEVTEVKQMELSDYTDIKQEIRNNLNRVVISFVEIGYYLKKVNQEKMFAEDGYKDIWEFAKSEYNLDRTAASRFMSINDKYSIDGNSINIQERYSGLSKSTLVEMLNLPVEDYELITPETKIADIRELKHEENNVVQDEQIEGQESFIEAPKPLGTDELLKEIILELFRPKEMKEQLNRFLKVKPADKEYEYIIEELNPSGNRVLKKIPLFCFMYKFSAGIKLKNVVNGSINSMSYEEFYWKVKNAFQQGMDEDDVWSATYGKEEKEPVEIAENVDSIQCETTSEPVKKEPENNVNTLEEPKEPEKVEEEEPETEVVETAESIDSTQCEVVSEPVEEVEETEPETACATPHKNTIILPVLPGEHIYLACIVGADDNMQPIYGVHTTSVYMYEYKNQRTIEMRYYNRKNDSAVCTVPVNGEYEQILYDGGIFLTKEEAERRCEELNAKEQEIQSDGV